MALLESSLFLAGAEALNTPGLIFFLERIEQNLAAVLRMVHGQAERLRPHVKTHKTREISRLWMALGVKKHKAATLVEAEMLAQEGAEDVLVSYPLVGPAPGALAVLAGAYPGTRFSALVDGWETLKGLQEAANSQSCQLGVMVDLDVGQHRTGVGQIPLRHELIQALAEAGPLVPVGIHAYDGHLFMEDLADRRRLALGVLAEAVAARELARKAGWVGKIPLVVSGSPAFSLHCESLDNVPDLELSPGTVVLFDMGYSRYEDLSAQFTPAAAILTRVISRPQPDVVTFDCGTKSIASDPPMAKRALVEGLEEAEVIGHNEEHLVLRTPLANHWPVGRMALAWPWHICPTVAWHDQAWLFNQGQSAGVWRIAARGRQKVARSDEPEAGWSAGQ